MADPSQIWKQNLELQAKLSSGTVKTALPENATDEQKATWRKENGLPDTAAGYEIALPDGLVVGEADKPLVAAYQEFAHANNMTPAQLNQNLGFYYQLQAQQAQARIAADNAFHDESLRALTTEWGDKDYKRNETMVANLMNLAPAGFKDKVLSGRTADGKLIGDHPDFLKWAAEIARQVVPVTTLIQPSAEAAAANNTRIGEIEKLMGDRSSAYWRGPTSGPMQQEYRELIQARTNNARGA